MCGVCHACVWCMPACVVRTWVHIHAMLRVGGRNACVWERGDSINHVHVVLDYTPPSANV